MIRFDNFPVRRFDSSAQTGSETAVLTGSMSRRKQVDANVAHLFTY